VEAEQKAKDIAHDLYENPKLQVPLKDMSIFANNGERCSAIKVK
jgi:hypothetical protein